MTTVEEVTRHSHFRLKVDLSKFFHDARRFCWIFVDRTKIQQVIHMKQHIGKLFNITEPFHLLLNDTDYLPPIEDVRILKENETILVVPGLGINEEEPAIVEPSNGSIYVNKAQTTNIKTRQETIEQDTSKDTLSNTQLSPIDNISKDCGNTTRDMTFYSVIDNTENGQSDGDTDSRTTDNNLTKDCNLTDSIVSIAKRKRVRKRKPKNRSRVNVMPSVTHTVEENVPKEPKLKKPKIIDSYIIPSGKHIRFDNTENDENNIAKQIVKEVSKNESFLSKASSSRELSTLLSLRQSSTPITFVSKKLKNEVKTENVLNDEVKSKNFKIVAASTEKKSCIKEPKNEIQNYKNLCSDIEKFPVMTRKPRANDIIAFKTLKIGADYTPQMSNTIFTEVVDSCIWTGNYTLRILYGKEEVQVPLGKFSLSEDEFENHPDGDTFLLNYSQMIEPRLIT